jgi:hypothetical protein
MAPVGLSIGWPSLFIFRRDLVELRPEELQLTIPADNAVIARRVSRRKVNEQTDKTGSSDADKMLHWGHQCAWSLLGSQLAESVYEQTGETDTDCSNKKHSARAHLGLCFDRSLALEISVVDRHQLSSGGLLAARTRNAMKQWVARHRCTDAPAAVYKPVEANTLKILLCSTTNIDSARHCARRLHVSHHTP